MLVADYASYAECQQRMYQNIADRQELGRLAIVNTAKSGVFAADRAITEYARNIWHVMA
jgi:starch phosphorylase